MLFDLGMKKAANDNEELSFITLLAATRNVTRFLNLDEPENVKREHEPDGRDREEQETAKHREYVERRLRELAAFERRASGKKI